MELRIIPASATWALRGEVLKQGLPEAARHYPGDDATDSFHLGAFEGERLLGVATFLREACPQDGGADDWRLRGMAVLASARNGGIGGQLLEAGVARAPAGRWLWCYGRPAARRFYERHGFVALGDEFDLPNSGAVVLLRRRLLRSDSVV